MCDTLVAVTDDGPLLGKNSDRDPNEAQRVAYHPARDHQPGAPLHCTWSTIPQVGHTHAVLLSQPWWMWGAEMGANEHGVVIGNEAVFTRGAPRIPTGSQLLGMDLLRLALERADSAERAVGVIVDLLGRHGQGGSCSHEHPRFTYDNSYLVADPSGAWVLETAGTAWAAEPVTGRARSISNGLTIEDFARSYADRRREQVSCCVLRRGATERSARAAEVPRDIATALRAHEFASPRWSPVTGALAGPCVHAGGAVVSTQSVASWVSDLRGGGGPHWVTGTSAPCISTFLPVTVSPEADGLGEPPAARPLCNAFDPTHRWWRHERLHRLVIRDHPGALARFRAARDRLEERWFAADPHALPEPTSAVADIERAEASWLADLEAAHLADRRPAWLRTLWSRLDAAARLQKETA